MSSELGPDCFQAVGPPHAMQAAPYPGPFSTCLQAPAVSLGAFSSSMLEAFSLSLQGTASFQNMLTAVGKIWSSVGRSSTVPSTWSCQELWGKAGGRAAQHQRLQTFHQEMVENISSPCMTMSRSCKEPMQSDQRPGKLPPSCIRLGGAKVSFYPTVYPKSPKFIHFGGLSLPSLETTGSRLGDLSSPWTFGLCQAVWQ